MCPYLAVFCLWQKRSILGDECRFCRYTVVFNGLKESSILAFELKSRLEYLTWLTQTAFSRLGIWRLIYMPLFLTILIFVIPCVSQLHRLPAQLLTGTKQRHSISPQLSSQRNWLKGSLFCLSSIIWCFISLTSSASKFTFRPFMSSAKLLVWSQMFSLLALKLCPKLPAEVLRLLLISH